MKLLLFVFAGVMRCTIQALLCLLSAAVVIHSQQQTIPYIHFMGVNLTNHSYVDLNLVGVGENDPAVQCHTDLQTCCNSDDGPDRGNWYGPTGDRVAFPGPTSGTIFVRRTERIDLRYTGTDSGSDSGIYRCTIETNAVNSEDNTAQEILYLGVYLSGGIIIHIKLLLILQHYSCNVCE